jgi:large subunit ribosomal protein L23
MRDYLYNVYGITVRGVRSYIQQQKLMQDKPGATNPRPRRWHRPRSVKRMMVEMDSGFVWPEEPKDFELYVIFICCVLNEIWERSGS